MQSEQGLDTLVQGMQSEQGLDTLVQVQGMQSEQGLDTLVQGMQEWKTSRSLNRDRDDRS